LRAAEKRRADFRVRYLEILPSDMNPNMTALENARAQVTALSGKLQDAVIERDSLRQEVENTPPMLVAEVGANAPGGPLGQTKLEQAEESLRNMMLRFTDQHPEVIAQKKLIEFLKGRGPEPATAKAGAAAGDSAAGTTGTPRRSVPNPVYDQLKVKLIEAEATVASLTRQRDEAVKTQDRLDKISKEQPGLFAEYQNMDRDYNVLRRNYEELLGRLQSANIAQAADTQADKVKLQVIDPPEIPRIPVAPNRPLLVTGVLLGGLAVGFGITILVGQFDRSFGSVDELRSLGLPVLGGISILGMMPLRQRFMTVLRFGAAVVVLVGVYGGLMVHILHSSATI
jgi:polysaccharide chain length determinant protein (PEP-CTERM system associated)